MMNCLFVFVGGGLGCVSRYLIDSLFIKIIKTNLLVPTVLVNVIGCFFMGFLCYLFLDKLNVPNHYKLFLTTGFCGGISTFSKFSIDIIKLFQDGKIITSVLYISLTFILCICATLCGIYLQKSL